jgi:hypothetical protein
MLPILTEQLLSTNPRAHSSGTCDLVFTESGSRRSRFRHVFTVSARPWDHETPHPSFHKESLLQTSRYIRCEGDCLEEETGNEETRWELLLEQSTLIRHDMIEDESAIYHKIR